MLGETNGPAADAAALRARDGYAAVVLRAGAIGGFVADAAGVHPIAAHPTMSVWPLGSGDTFSAVFSAAWGSGADPVEAAQIASNATAWWCGNRSVPVPPQILNGSATYEDLAECAQDPLAEPSYNPRVYLGGPFFTVAERWLVELVRGALFGLGARPFSPIHDVGVGDASVAVQDIAGLAECDVMLALLDHYDPGTVYEAGWAASRGIPVIAYRHNGEGEGDKMLVGLGAEVHSDLSAALYRAVWVAQGAKIRPGRHG